MEETRDRFFICIQCRLNILTKGNTRFTRNTISRSHEDRYKKLGKRLFLPIVLRLNLNCLPFCSY